MLHISKLLRLPYTVTRLPRCNVSTGEFGPLVIPAKESKSVQADVVNYGSDGVYFTAYNQHGFLLNSGVKIVGPCAAFPRNAFCWNQAAVGTFNFLNSEGRYIAAAMIPPRRMDIYDRSDNEANRLLASEEHDRMEKLLEMKQTIKPKLLTGDITEPRSIPRSPLLPPPESDNSDKPM